MINTHSIFHKLIKQPTSPVRTAHSDPPSRVSPQLETDTVSFDACREQGGKGNGSVILVAGPGGWAFGKEQVDIFHKSMRETGARVKVVGDGVSTISLSDVESSLKELPESGEKTSIFVMAHGDTKGGDHKLKLGEEFNTSSADLFRKVTANADGKPVDVFLTACSGGDALRHTEILPKGSSVVVLSEGHEPTSGFDVERLASSIKDGSPLRRSLSSKSLLKDYLCSSLKNRISPDIRTSGESSYVALRSKFLNRIGSDFSADERERVKSELAGRLSDTEADRIMDKISASKDEGGIYAVEYGPALAVCMAAEKKHKHLIFDDK